MVFSCNRCAKCCREYWITILPRERKVMAQELGIAEKEFSKKYCQLLLQLFPLSEEKKGLFVSTEKLPKKIYNNMKKRPDQLPVGFLVLPSIALKRKKNACAMLDARNNCLVHDSKPGQCNLFPFISMAEAPDFLELYGFCNGLRAEKTAPKDRKQKVLEHQTDFSNHFKEINKKGFAHVWGFWPKKGVVLLKTQKICSINEKEFFKTIKKFA